MLKSYVSLYYVFLALPSILAAHKNNNTKTTTVNPLSNILSKFHQNDYKIAYEWSDVLRVDKRFGDFSKHTFKYNRTTTAVNGTMFSNVDMGYDIEVIVQAYKFASNEYRFFPMRFQFNFCEAVAKQAMSFDRLFACGNFSCPVLKGKRYYYCNFTPEDAQFPPLIPTGRYMLELQFMYHSYEVFVTREYGAVYRPIV